MEVTALLNRVGSLFVRNVHELRVRSQFSNGVQVIEPTDADTPVGTEVLQATDDGRNLAPAVRTLNRAILTHERAPDAVTEHFSP